jgi:hypothetical protein
MNKNPPMSARSYERVIAKLKAVITEIQWVQPTYNGNDSCAGCGRQRHNGCADDCPVAAITGDCGGA